MKRSYTLSPAARDEVSEPREPVCSICLIPWSRHADPPQCQRDGPSAPETTKAILREGESGVEAVSSRTAPTNESHAQHMPLPWRVFGRRDQAVADANGDGVAWCATGINEPACEANAAFIVTAVNSHDALLAACKTARYVHEHTTALTPDECAQLEAAINLAEGH